MAGGEQGKNTTHENAIGWMILGVIFFVVFLIVWPMIDEPVKSGARWFRYGEMWVISLFVDADDYMVRWEGQEIPLKAVMKITAATPPDELTSQAFSLMSTAAMQPLRFIFIGILTLMALWAYRSGPGTQFRRKLNLDGLIGVQAKVFKVIEPFVKFNPNTLPSRPPGSPVPAELPIFAEALGPEEWIAYNQIPLPDGKLEEHTTYMAFARQLGPRWQGVKTLPPYKQILLAAFCLKASRKRKEADDLLGRVAACWSQEKGLQLGRDRTLLSEVRKILANDKLSGLVLQKANMHAFQTTALLRALQTAREQGGVMAPAQFVWLRGHDRTLWYPMNNLGRQGFHMEAIGAMAHFKAEKLTNRPIPRPKLDAAIGSLNEYMASRRARPIPQLDYSNVKKGGVKKPAGGIKKPRVA
jgi:intracellular multiplication protein IcmP